MSIRRLLPVVGIALVLFAGYSLFSGGGSGSLLSLDNSSQSQSTTDRSKSQGSGQQGSDTKPGRPTPTADAASIDVLDQEAIQKKAFILLNPASATAGSTVGVAGAGFDPASVIDLYITSDPNNDQKPQELGFAQADSGGSFGSFSFSLPPNYRVPTFTVIARQRNSNNEAMATGRLESLRPSVKLGTNVGVVGDIVQISAQGFMPEEEVKVFFNSLSGEPFQTFTTSNGGSIEKQSIRVPYGPVGNNSVIFIGSESQSPVTVQFLMLTLYPNVAISSYATKADTVLAFSGAGFGPEEEVTVHLNNPQAPPVITFKTDGSGTFDNAGAFIIPFELAGKNTLIFIGQLSQATATAGFDVLPYTPNVQPSTYGGRPGTSITFYGDGFAREEVVRFYLDRTRDSKGREVACAKADSQGRIGAGGSYTIPPDAQTGQLTFTVIGGRSRAVTTTTVEVMEAGVPVQVQDEPQQEYQCPFDDVESANEVAPAQTAQPAPPVPTVQRTQPSMVQPQLTPQPTAPRPTARPAVSPAATPSSRTEQPQQENEPVMDVGGGVELFSDPLNPSSAKATLETGNVLELLGDRRTVGNEEWIRVTVNGQEGWVREASVQPMPLPRVAQPSDQ